MLPQFAIYSFKNKNLHYNITTNRSIIGKKLVYLPKCQSTNDIALNMCASGLGQDGLTVIAGEQTAGRGQRGNRWESKPFQNLTFSVVLSSHGLKARHQFALNIAVSVGVLTGLDELFGSGAVDLKIKWPNDIYYGDKKIGGILIEGSTSGVHLTSAVVGVGLNVNQISFSNPTATSLFNIFNRTFDLNEVFNAIIEGMDDVYAMLLDGNIDRLKYRYLQRLYQYQELREYEIVSSGERVQGEILGIDAWGRLTLNIKGAFKYFYPKEIVFVL